MALQFNDNPLLVFCLLVVIGGMFVLALKMLSTGSGWAELASRYPEQASARGESFAGVSLNSSRRGSYGRQLIVVVDRHALHLSMHLPSRLFHRPISVPWERIGGSSHPILGNLACSGFPFRKWIWFSTWMSASSRQPVRAGKAGSENQ